MDGTTARTWIWRAPAARPRVLPGVARCVLLGVALCAVGAGFAGCGGGGDRPDVVLITIDTLRADHVGAYGDVDARTPTLDRLAEEGVRFDQVQSPAPLTLPSHATILTGQLPSRHGVRNNGSYRLGDSAPTLAEVFSEAGYTTAAFVAAAPLLSRYGLARGFDHYDDRLDSEAGAFQHRERRADEVVDAALAWARGAGERPMLLWVHLFEPHQPYDLVPPFDEDFADRPYDGEIAAADAAVGRLLEGLAALRDGRPCITTVTSDHGEGLGEHGEPTHAVFVHQSTLRVPWILHAPGRVAAGLVVREPVGLVDVAPTLVALAGIDAVLDADGIAIDPSRPVARRAFLSESLFGYEIYGWSPLFALREGDHKVIAGRSARAFDLDADPHETTPVEAAWARDLEERLIERIRTMPAPSDADRRSPTDQEREALAALGYVGGSSGAVAGSGPDLLAAMRQREDPATRIEEFNRTTLAELAFGRGEYARCIAITDTVLAENPGNAWARSLRASALVGAGLDAEAVEALAEALAVAPPELHAKLRLDRARALWRLGRRDEAVADYRRTLDLDPTARTRRELASLLTQRAESRWRSGRTEDAAADFAEAVDLDPRLARAHNGLAWLWATELGRPVDALAHAEAAVELAPDEPEFHDTHLEVLVRLGRIDEARQRLESLRRRFPTAAVLEERASTLHERP